MMLWSRKMRALSINRTAAFYMWIHLLHAEFMQRAMPTEFCLIFARKQNTYKLRLIKLNKINFCYFYHGCAVFLLSIRREFWNSSTTTFGHPTVNSCGRGSHFWNWAIHKYKKSKKDIVHKQILSALGCSSPRECRHHWSARTCRTYGAGLRV